MKPVPMPLRIYGHPLAGGGGEVAFAHRLIIFVALCAILMLGRDILIPVVLAILFAVLLTPILRGAQHLGIPKTLSVVSIVVMTVMIMAGTTILVGRTLTNLATDLPSYESNLRDKARSLKLIAGGNVALDRAAGVLEDLRSELETGPVNEVTPVPAAKPIPVEVYDTRYGPLAPVLAIVTMIAHPLAQVGIMILMLTFILFNREDLRDRLIRLAGTGDIHRTTVALDEAGSRLSRMFLGQLAINASTGSAIALSLLILGVPGAILWGMLTAILRFVPFIGTMLSSILPIIIALAVSDGWLLPLATAAIIIAAEVVAGNILEPVFLGRMTGVSSTAIVISAAFWASLWGPVGLILPTPITVGLMVVGRHIESLHFLHVLFGTEPVLDKDHAFYHRMLAEDGIEAAQTAHDYRSNNRLGDFLNEVAIPGLMIARHDLDRGVLDKQGATRVATTFSETLDEIWAGTPPISENAAVTLVACHGALNFAATVAFSALLRSRMIPHRKLPQDAISPGKGVMFADGEITHFCLCSLIAASPAQLDYISRRLRQHHPGAQVINVAWSDSEGRGDVHPPASAASMLPVKSFPDDHSRQTV